MQNSDVVSLGVIPEDVMAALEADGTAKVDLNAPPPPVFVAKEPKNQAEKLLHSIGAYDLPLWLKPGYKHPQYNDRPAGGNTTREQDRRQRQMRAGTLRVSPTFVPKPSHPDAPVREGESRQVLRRKARLEGKASVARMAKRLRRMGPTRPVGESPIGG